jgi:hypothetical protein
VLLFTSFSIVAGLYAALLWFGGGTPEGVPYVSDGVSGRLTTGISPAKALDS